MVAKLSTAFEIPPIADIFFPPFCPGGQPKEAEFMAMCLEDGSAGISYVLLPDATESAYRALRPADFSGRDPRDFALGFGGEDPVLSMVGLSAVNAVCQHVMRVTGFTVDSATDSLGLLSVAAGDRIGMVGLFFPLIETIAQSGAELVIVEKNASLKDRYPRLPITLDPALLRGCNKILCTGTTVLNLTLDEILSHCSPAALVSVIGPSTGYFPDPLFARGVDIVGGRVVRDGALLLKLLAEKKRWGAATEKICFCKETYTGLPYPVS